MDATFPLDRAADAHRLLEGGDVIGKIVLISDFGGYPRRLRKKSQTALWSTIAAAIGRRSVGKV